LPCSVRTTVKDHASTSASSLSSIEALFISSATSAAASFSCASSDSAVTSPFAPVSFAGTFFARPSRRLASLLGGPDEVEGSNASFSRRSTSFWAAAMFWCTCQHSTHTRPLHQAYLFCFSILVLLEEIKLLTELLNNRWHFCL
jgi:hypothetical protein